MEKILVSACLLGEKVRYSGGAATCDDPVLLRWLAEGRVVSCCPEVAGGLGTPRPRAERQALRVLTESAADVTSAFVRGAEHARDTARAVWRAGQTKNLSPVTSAISRFADGNDATG